MRDYWIITDGQSYGQPTERRRESADAGELASPGGGR